MYVDLLCVCPANPGRTTCHQKHCLGDHRRLAGVMLDARTVWAASIVSVGLRESPDAQPQRISVKNGGTLGVASLFIRFGGKPFVSCDISAHVIGRGLVSP
jgi:hypothetical protein